MNEAKANDDLGFSHKIISLKDQISKGLSQRVKNSLEEENYIKLPLKLALDPKNLVYHSPEIIQGEYDEKSDVWAIGIVLFYVLCGDLPFQSIDDGKIKL